MVNHFTKRNFFVVQSRLIISACTIPTGHRGNRGTGTRELNRTVLDLDSMALISWLLRWGVVLVTVATKCEEGVSTVWVFPGGKGGVRRVDLTNVQVVVSFF